MDNWWLFLLAFLILLFFLPLCPFECKGCKQEGYANQILHGVAGGIGGPISMVDLPKDCIPKQWGSDEYPHSGYPPSEDYRGRIGTGEEYEGYQAEQSVDDPSIYGGDNGYGGGGCGSCQPFLGPNPYRQARV